MASNNYLNITKKTSLSRTILIVVLHFKKINKSIIKMRKKSTLLKYLFLICLVPSTIFAQISSKQIDGLLNIVNEKKFNLLKNQYDNT